MPVEGTPCLFRTCYDVDMYPLSLEHAELQRTGASAQLTLRFALDPGVSIEALQLDALRLYLRGEPFVSQALYLWLRRYLTAITVQPVGAKQARQRLSLPPAALQPVGFADDEGLLPYPPTAFVGYRLLQEYFTLPEKFLFVDITGLGAMARLDVKERFEIICDFSHAPDEQVRITQDNIALFCTPIVNLFTRDADPVRLEHDKVQYLVRPSGQNPEHYEIYSIDHVSGWMHGSGERQTYYPFLSFDHEVTADHRQTVYYRTRLMPAVIGRGADTYVAFVSPGDEHAFPSTETISFDLTCTNRHVPEGLRIGDIAVQTTNSPEFARFRNIAQVTPSLLPPLDRGLHWQLISNMSLNYISLMNVDALRLILSTYNFQAYDDRPVARAHELRMEGIAAIRYKAVDRLLRGSPVRGLRIDMDMQSSKFNSEGDMYLLASVLHEFFTLYATINAFHQLVVRNVESAEVYQWPVKIGQQPLL